MSLAMLTGRAPEPICEALGLRPVPDEHAVLMDARDLDPAERDALEASRVRRLAADPHAVRAALNDLSAGDVYLHIDVDIIDGEELPGLRFPAAAGPSFSVVEECLAQIVDADSADWRLHRLCLDSRPDRRRVDASRDHPTGGRDRRGTAMVRRPQSLTPMT